MASVQISSLTRSSIESFTVSVVVGSVAGDKLGVCGKKSVGEKERKTDVGEIVNDNDDSCGEIEGKVALTSIDREDADEERDESKNTLKLMMDVSDEKHDTFLKSISSDSSMFPKSSVK